jgi:hypothetical protein
MLRCFVFSTRLRQNSVILTVRPEYLGKYLALHATSNANGVHVERSDETLRLRSVCCGPDRMVIYLVTSDIDLQHDIQITLPTMI